MCVLDCQTIAIFGGDDVDYEKTSDGIAFDVKTRTAKPILGGEFDVRFCYSSLGHQIGPEEYLTIGTVGSSLRASLVKLFVSPDRKYFETRLIEKQ